RGPRGGVGGRPLGRARHYQPPQDRDSLGPMRLTFLGTGTSFGVAQIGCECAVCRSDDPRDRRTRTGAVVEAGGARLLLDTPPELRVQLLGAGIGDVDAVLYTH